MTWDKEERRSNPPADFGPMIEEATQKALERVLTRIGVDHENPLEQQEDFAFLRKQRKGAEQAGMWVKRSVLMAFVSALLWLGVEGFKHVQWK